MLPATLHLATSDVTAKARFYEKLGFGLEGEIVERDGRPIFATLMRGASRLRIELWQFPNWEIYRPGFSITTLWIETESIAAVGDSLRDQGLNFEGPVREDYGSIEIELFDPEGFRIIFAQPAP